ncbi:Ig-like domain-containing protein [Kitasatospora sp. NPDC049285]|uniref:Ig-like domain-containing protein n=1 Tax=Kitasatospora sp. NPDC049285 TaxID=3157096 RepID=UPI0034323A3D
MCRQFPRGSAVLIATGLLVGLNTPLAGGQQTPDGWSAERRAVLPSGLGIQLDFAAAPGVTATTAPGKLAERAGGGSAYTDGIRPGDPAETFLVAERRPGTDGSWHTLGTLQLTFTRPVRNPRLHVSGLAGLATGKDGSTGTATRLTVTGGSPSAPTLVGRTGWNGWTVGAGELAPVGDGTQDGSADGTGTLELAGTFTTVSFRVEQRSTARSGSTTAPAALRQAYTVTLDEGLGTAPQGYGNASHLVSDLFLGQDAVPAATRNRPGLTQSVSRPLLPGPPPAPAPPPPDAGPVGPSVELDGGQSRRSPWSNPAPPQLQPGRTEYQGADPSLRFPTEAAVGRYYHLDVPVSPGSGAAVLAGWIDFDHNGRFDAAERVQTDVPAGASTAALEWQVPSGAAGGETWARLRLARGGAQLVGSGGFADSGQVVDQKVSFSVGAAQPEISLPVPGTVTADNRPEFRGEGAVPGASVAVREGDATLCTARAGNDGTWACRPDHPLGEGAHTLVPVETTRSGMVLRGDPIRLTVKTAPPTAPQLTLPAYTNDPGLLVTGLGEPGSTVTVTVTSSTPGRAPGELCSTAVAADGSWSCLPVENLPDGRYQLTPIAVDGAGNRVDGKPAGLTIDTTAPDKPTLTAPASGELLHSARPRLAGRAEPGSTVTVTVTAAAKNDAARFTLCSALTAADGTWSCTATRDLPPGDLTLLPTATDPAGNGTPGDPVPVRVAAAPGTPAPTASPSPSASASGSASGSSSAAASPSAVGTPSGSASASAGGALPGTPSASASASASAADVASSSPSATAVSPMPSDSALPSGSPSGAPAPSPSGSTLPVFDPPVPLPPGLFPIVVPPVFGPTPGQSSAAASPSGSAAPSAQTAPSASAAAPAVPIAPPGGPGASAPADGSPTGSPSTAGQGTGGSAGGAGVGSSGAGASPSGGPSTAGPGVGVSAGGSATGASPSGSSSAGAAASGAPVPGSSASEASTMAAASALAAGRAPSAGAPSAAGQVPVVGAASASPGAPRSALPSTSPSTSLSPVAAGSVAASASASVVPSGPGSPVAAGKMPSEPKTTATAMPADPDRQYRDAEAADEARSRTPAAPPPDTAVAAHREAATGWRGVACGVLLMLAAMGLLTRRVFGRGSGTRRR